MPSPYVPRFLSPAQRWYTVFSGVCLYACLSVCSSAFQYDNCWTVNRYHHEISGHRRVERVDKFKSGHRVAARGWWFRPNYVSGNVFDANCQPGTFPVVGPRIWNDLPADLTSAESLSILRQRLKTHLFTKSFFGYFLVVNQSKIV